MQHNMLAASSLYASISFTELATLLQTTPDRAEAVAVAMIREGRMQGSIDQVDGLLCFSGPCVRACVCVCLCLCVCVSVCARG
jgi:hypothetical protein